MKTLYLIRHAKSDWSNPNTRDFERPISIRGERDLEIMSSFLSLRAKQPDVVLSSCSLRTQQTTDALTSKTEYTGVTHYLKELYLSSAEVAIDLIQEQSRTVDTIMLVGHNPQINEVANMLLDEHISKVPTLGIIAINFDIQEWFEISDIKGRLEFFVYPKQFKYYMPDKIRQAITR